MPEFITIGDRRYEVKQVLGVWDARRQEAEEARKEYLPQIKINRKFLAGKQHLKLNTKDGRVLELPRRYNGVELIESNILDQYVNTVIGRLASADYRSNFLVSHETEIASQIAEQMNLAFGWGWENEWKGDEKVLALWRYLSSDGTVAVRCRYDRRKGEIIGDEVPYVNGVPILDEEKRRKYVADMAAKGQTAEFGVLREGKVIWEVFTAEGILPPPGYEDPSTFPWEILVRAVSVDEIKNRYGKNAEDVADEEIEDSGSLTSGLGIADGKPQKLQGKALVYTGYERPNEAHPKGRTVVFTKDALLDVRESLPYVEHPNGPSSGVHYFRWQVLPGRFWGKAFIENGIGPQKVLNKRLTQINAIMDRGLPKVFIEAQSLARPKTGEPMEIIEVNPGAPLPNVNMGINPGSWMMEDIKLQIENAQRALGIHSTTMGQAPQGVSAYSAMALLSENDSLKLDPVAQSFRQSMNGLCWDTMEAMRNWPPGKQLLIGGPEQELRVHIFQENMIPYQYLVRQPSGGALPRSQAAEIQKINDIWQAAQGKLPLTWYYDSLEAGKAQELPASIGDQDAHKAELENIAMASSLQSAPVAPYDDDNRHVEIHRAFQIPLTSLADMGDPEAAQKVQVLEQHINEHLQAAQAQQAPPLTPEQGIPSAPPGMPPQGPQQPPQGLSPSPMG